METDEKKTNHPEKNKELRNGQAIRNEQELHQAESGNVSGREAEKDMTGGPANDLVSLPKSEE